MNRFKDGDPTLRLVVLALLVLALADIAAAVFIRVYAEAMPTVAGDVSKVCAGGLVGLLYGNGHNGGTK